MMAAARGRAMRILHLAGVAVFIAAFTHTALAQVWRDAATGEPVASGPILDPIRPGSSIFSGDEPYYYRAVLPNPRGDTNRAFDPRTGRTFVRSPCHSTETATVPTPTPQIGMVIEPKISIGLGGSSGTSTYDSTGGQAPFNGDWSHSTAQVCGGATFYPGFVIGPARVGLDVNVCSGSNTFGSGDTALFTIMRHGPGDVDLHASTNVIID